MTFCRHCSSTNHHLQLKRRWYLHGNVSWASFVQLITNVIDVWKWTMKYFVLICISKKNCLYMVFYIYREKPLIDHLKTWEKLWKLYRTLTVISCTFMAKKSKEILLPHYNTTSKSFNVSTKHGFRRIFIQF